MGFALLTHEDTYSPHEVGFRAPGPTGFDGATPPRRQSVPGEQTLRPPLSLVFPRTPDSEARPGATSTGSHGEVSPFTSEPRFPHLESGSRCRTGERPKGQVLVNWERTTLRRASTVRGEKYNSLFVDDTIVYTANPKGSTQKP